MSIRDNFTAKIKKKLAERVAWRCSFPGCNLVTVGPGNKDSTDVTNLGEAAHIYAASENGPRPNPEMSSEQRKSIDNGIWLCRSHARLIDKDYTQYSALTLMEWKDSAEKSAYDNLTDLSKSSSDIPKALVSLGDEVIFEGLWKSVQNNAWTFEVADFIVGDIEALREFSARDQFITIESQGDGRLLENDFSWNLIDGKYDICVRVKEKQPRTDPNDMGGDIALDDDWDLKIENGDLATVSGVDSARQALFMTLSLNFGELFSAPTIGSHFRGYFKKFKENRLLLNRLLKMDISRLISIPFVEDNDQPPIPPLNFINRIIEVEIITLNPTNQRIPVRLKLEWGNGEIWNDIIQIYVGEPSSASNLIKDWLN